MLMKLQPEGTGAVIAADTRHVRVLDNTPMTQYLKLLIGVYLALELMEKLPPHASHCAIYLDNQAAITAIASKSKPQSGQYIIAEVHKKLERIKRHRQELGIILTWLPGHERIPGNEAAGRKAKDIRKKS